MIDCNSVTVPMQPGQDLLAAPDNDESIPFRQLIGALLFIARLTWPDIAFAVSKLSQFISAHNNTHWEAAKKLLQYLKGTVDLGFLYKRTTFDKEEVKLFGYSDADYTGDKQDRKSTGGFAFFLNQSLITWGSNKQPIVSCSSTESEYIALAATCREAMWLKNHMDELNIKTVQPIEIMVDNQSAIKLSKKPEFHKRTKHIDVRYHYSRELLMEKKIDVIFVPTDDQTADILTKPLLKGKHKIMCKNLGLVSKDQEKSPQHQNTKTVIQKTGMALLTLMFILSFITNSTSVTTLINQPVIWRPAANPITSGHNEFHLVVKFVDPCSILTPDTVHHHLLPAAKAK